MAQRPIKEPTPSEEPTEPEPTEADPAEPEELARSLADLLEDRHSASAWIPNLRRLHIDQARVAAAGIRKVSGPRLTLYTDLSELEAIDRLPEIVAQAFPQWCEFFRIDPEAWPDWELTGFLMKDKARFDSAGLIPRYLPDFEHGFSWNYEFWLYEQPSDYYRRHLTLHEGTHCFMNTILGSCGPSWYMEATAELLATHRLDENRLSMNHFPANREEVPMWGRIRIAKDAYAEQRAKTFDSIIQDRGPYLQQTEPYAWRWAVAALLDRHPRYHDRFRMLSQFVTNRRFTDRFYETFDDDLQAISEE